MLLVLFMFMLLLCAMYFNIFSSENVFADARKAINYRLLTSYVYTTFFFSPPSSLAEKKIMSS